MPSASKTQRAEARYNVVFDYTNLGLHAAAASGNLGLVKYALDHEQPVNSVLDGLLPLHAACHGGSDLVVRYLIEKGADVNTPRLSRRLTTDKHRATSPSLSIPGPSGSTPLHFAAANGHLVVVMTLLLHGASPDRPDKHGTTPEMIARQNGHTSCADVLRGWCHNKDRDLREREAGPPPPLPTTTAEDSFSKDDKSHHYCGSLECRECATRKRIRMKRSIDSAIHMLRHSPSQCSGTISPPHSSTSIHSTAQQPPSPTEGKPLGEYSFYPTATNDSTVEELHPRRPSLPHVLDVPRTSTSSSRSRRPSNLSTHSRPRSAGTDAEASTRVRGKISLLNIFKKANDTTVTPDSNNSPSGSTGTSVSASPAPTSIPGMTPLPPQSSDMLAPNAPEGTHKAHHHHRLLSESAAMTVTSSHPLDVRHSASRESLRGRGQPFKTTAGEPLGKGSPPVRPGILRAHGRSTSSGQSTPQSDNPRTTTTAPSTAAANNTTRALRFDSTSSAASGVSHHPVPAPRRTESLKRTATASSRQESRSPSRRVSGKESIGSFKEGSPSPGSKSFGLRLESEPEVLSALPSPAPTPSVSAALLPDPRIEEENEVDGDEEEEYGYPVSPRVGIRELSVDRSGRRRTRRGSVVSTTVSEVDSQDTMHQLQHHHHGFQCPFSINRPPPQEDVQSEMETPTAAPGDAHSVVGERDVEVSSETSRMRGNSMSSMVTDSSAGPPSSFVPTPSMHQSNLPGPILFAPSSVPNESSPFSAVDERDEMVLNVEGASPVKRSKTPGEIDIRSISTHAQAEALVALAQRRILEQPVGELNEQEIKTFGLVGAGAGGGHTPLSARLAAYGESLAIERRFKEVEEKRRKSVLMNSVSADTLVGERDRGEEGAGLAVKLDRQVSLDERRREGSPVPRFSSDAVTGFLSPPSALNGTTSISNPESSGRLHRTHSSSGMIITPPFAESQTRSDSLPTDRSSLPRSRTPDPQFYAYDALPPPSAATLGVPLTRYQTCPTDDSYDFVNSARTVKERQVARAQKLAKMGFSGSGAGVGVGGEHWRDASSGSRVQRPRFGGIKTFVQSLTGKA
ncbi:hypothetical protein BDY19DRAFT_990083 [Irpex rosettiformis]|uniref:Uncharacterized protein n=1 Tax=Irpex rosettiformis TaxID=378272 RepID=A0ACB8UGH2_9APHY|nr:hypothetical protein BDY19DRAFT_990083 [Irpex rosettiformis]